ncbi:hypothetical protein PWY87_28765 [Kribbella solani]|uniref:hypothetical protein n=1 Tax=Kribbella solani TaxID=236067 RepID=UPI0029AD118F|nr:hypothetical protein [Kribbella solani]MDX2974469.1 hypothetical protein [Kribbella solani]MDX3005706.1 hypothetical protein [Kribbella solani]
MNPTQPTTQPQPPVSNERRRISRAARRRVHARELRVRRTQKDARAQLPVW